MNRYISTSELSWYDKYRELVQEIGLVGAAETLPPHDDVIKNTKDITEKAWMYDDLCK